MTARAGGEADKFGNRYEGRWTVWHLLEILQGHGSRITVEPIGSEGDGAEFTYQRADGRVEAHQVKRASRSANNWTVRSLHSLGIWTNAATHVAAGREYHFLSIVPAVPIQSLCAKARQANSVDEFVKSWLSNGDMRSAFDELCKADIFGSAEAAWTTLRNVRISWPDESHLVHVNAVVSELLLSGAQGRLAAAALGELIVENLGSTLDASLIESKLSQYGLSLVQLTAHQVTSQSVQDATERWFGTVHRELLVPPIARAETRSLLDLLRLDDSTQVAFVAGTAGGGKSAVLAAAVAQLQEDAVAVLAFRLDRLEDFATTKELGQRVGFELSPVAALAAAAGPNSSVLVIDQLDAVSFASGRLPNSFSAVADLVDEAQAFPRMKIVLACRQFDINNDDRIRRLQTSLKADPVSVATLTDDEIDAAVSGMGLDASALRPSQREVLRIPLHLVLLQGVANEANALDFQTTAHLFEAYWNRKRNAVRDRERARPIRFTEVVSRVSTAISDRQRLSVSDTILDADDLYVDANVLVSEHILVRDSGQVAFFHEALFDFAFARQWESSGESLVAFLTRSEQELFRRAQVRQIMYHLRQRDTDRFEWEVRTTILSHQVRFHVKDAMVAVLGGL
ncbi:MAG: hypothetical protein QOE30_217, partial [Mycobacterium sp.]|uniref:hypothetical protein n=1 Tax=Mycobacterium sp. TaxID=1785 RepID=UPI0028B60139